MTFPLGAVTIGAGPLGSFFCLFLPVLSVLVGISACLNHFEQAAEWEAGMYPVDWLVLGSLKANHQAGKRTPQH